MSPIDNGATSTVDSRMLLLGSWVTPRMGEEAGEPNVRVASLVSLAPGNLRALTAGNGRLLPFHHGRWRCCEDCKGCRCRPRGGRAGSLRRGPSSRALNPVRGPQIFFTICTMSSSSSKCSLPTRWGRCLALDPHTSAYLNCFNMPCEGDELPNHQTVERDVSKSRGNHRVNPRFLQIVTVTRHRSIVTRALPS